MKLRFSSMIVTVSAEVAAALVFASLVLALPGCGNFLGGSGEKTPADTPVIRDLTATPNPAHAGEVVEISFMAWYAGGGDFGGDWGARLTERPPAGGRLQPNSFNGIRGSPYRCTASYVTGGPTQATIRVEVMTYGTCSGVLCSVDIGYAEQKVSVTVLDP